MDCQALPGIDVKNRETPEASATSSSIMDKVKSPLVVDLGRNRQGKPQGNGELLPRFGTDSEILLLVKPFCPLVIDNETLFLEEYMEASYSVSWFLLGKLFHPRDNLFVHSWFRGIPEGTPAYSDQGTGSSFFLPEVLLYIKNHTSSHLGRQYFLESTCLNAWMSRA
jgi:hypothetical protein